MKRIGRRGITLIVLIVTVIVVVVLLSAAIIRNSFGILDIVRVGRFKSDLSTIKEAVGLYVMSNDKEPIDTSKGINGELANLSSLPSSLQRNMLWVYNEQYSEEYGNIEDLYNDKNGKFYYANLSEIGINFNDNITQNGSLEGKSINKYSNIIVDRETNEVFYQEGFDVSKQRWHSVYRGEDLESKVTEDYFCEDICIDIEKTPTTTNSPYVQVSISSESADYIDYCIAEDTTGVTKDNYIEYFQNNITSEDWIPYEEPILIYDNNTTVFAVAYGDYGIARGFTYIDNIGEVPVEPKEREGITITPSEYNPDTNSVDITVEGIGVHDLEYTLTDKEVPYSDSIWTDPDNYDWAPYMDTFPVTSNCFVNVRAKKDSDEGLAQNFYQVLNVPPVPPIIEDEKTNYGVAITASPFPEETSGVVSVVLTGENVSKMEYSLDGGILSEEDRVDNLKLNYEVNNNPNIHWTEYTGVPIVLSENSTILARGIIEGSNLYTDVAYKEIYNISEAEKPTVLLNIVDTKTDGNGIVDEYTVQISDTNGINKNYTIGSSSPVSYTESEKEIKVGENTVINATVSNDLGVANASLTISGIGDVWNSGNVNAPILTKGEKSNEQVLIPVKYVSPGKWVKVDVQYDKWYSYLPSIKMWANAVSVNSNYRQKYLNAAPGTEILMDEIEAMWVWIPRYAYKITSGLHSSTAGNIDIKFIQGLGDPEDTTYTLHPAFALDVNNDINNTLQLPGIWVAKFASSMTKSVVNKETIYSIKSKPNLAIWKTNFKTAVSTSINMVNNANYGLNNGGNTGVDTHLIKNSEWGAIAYLSQSLIGRAGQEIYLNNGSNSGNGGSKVNSPKNISKSNTFEYDKGAQNSSTTGNVYGIYDMAGVSSFVGAYLNSQYSNLLKGQLGIYMSSNKYFNIYPMSTYESLSKATLLEKTVNNYKQLNSVLYKGGSLYETSSEASSSSASAAGKSSWMNDYSVYLTGKEGRLILRRSGATGTDITNNLNKGIYAFSPLYETKNLFSFRPVLILKDGAELLPNTIYNPSICIAQKHTDSSYPRGYSITDAADITTDTTGISYISKNQTMVISFPANATKLYYKVWPTYSSKENKSANIITEPPKVFTEISTQKDVSGNFINKGLSFNYDTNCYEYSAKSLDNVVVSNKDSIVGAYYVIGGGVSSRETFRVKSDYKIPVIKFIGPDKSIVEFGEETNYSVLITDDSEITPESATIDKVAKSIAYSIIARNTLDIRDISRNKIPVQFVPDQIFISNDGNTYKLRLDFTNGDINRTFKNSVGTVYRTDTYYKDSSGTWMQKIAGNVTATGYDVLANNSYMDVTISKDTFELNKFNINIKVSPEFSYSDKFNLLSTRGITLALIYLGSNSSEDLNPSKTLGVTDIAGNQNYQAKSNMFYLGTTSTGIVSGNLSINLDSMLPTWIKYNSINKVTATLTYPEYKIGDEAIKRYKVEPGTGGKYRGITTDFSYTDKNGVLWWKYTAATQKIEVYKNGVFIYLMSQNKDIESTSNKKVQYASANIINIDEDTPIINFAKSGGYYDVYASTEVTAMDVSLDKIEYIWSSDSNTPAANDSRWSASSISNVTTFNNKIAKSAIITNPQKGGSWYLHIKATDSVNNVTRSSSLLFTDDTIDPTLTFEPSTDSLLTKLGIRTNVKLNATDNSGGSGINSSTFRYIWSKQNTSVPEGSWTLYTGSITPPGIASGVVEDWYLWATVSDNSGNTVRPIVSPKYTINNVATALATPTITPDRDISTWNKEVGIKIDYPVDTASRQYKINEGEWVNVDQFSTNLIITQNCNITAKCMNDFEITSEKSILISNIDTTVPTVPSLNLYLSNFSTTYVSGNWTNSNIIVQPTGSTDATSQISKYEIFKEDGTLLGSCSPGGTLTITLEGVTKINARAVDLAGNASVLCSIVNINIDKTPPSAPTLTPSTAAWTNGDVNVTIGYPADANLRQYSTDGTATWNNYSSAIVVSNNNTTIYARAIDAAGNQSSQSTLTVANIDKTTPSKPSVNLNGYVSNTLTSNNVVQSFTSTDSLSGIQKYQFSHDLSGWTDCPNPWTISWDGAWNFYIRAVDNVGNVSPASDMYTIRRYTGGTINYGYTASQQTYVVPVGVYSIYIDCAGARGGYTSTTSPYTAGYGGGARGNISVTPGEVLYLYVGGVGRNYKDNSTGTYLYGAGGWNGGGNGGYDTSNNGSPGAGGGGATDIRKGGNALNNRILVAGGGAGVGGYGTHDSRIPGHGGGVVGYDAGGTSTTRGLGGTQTAGGAGGYSSLGSSTYGTAGYFGYGGNGGRGAHGGGGGGAGWYGGGGGAITSNYGMSGGGGSGYANPSYVTNSVLITGYNYDYGWIRITPVN